MAKKTVKEGDLINYTHAMIRHAVYNYPNDVVYLLESNGVTVPQQNVTPEMLHTMTLKAVQNSQSFNQGMVELLHNIAMDDQHEKYKKKNGASAFVNQTGAAATDTTCCASWFSETFNPKMVDTLLTAGVGLVSKQLGTEGDGGIKKVVQPTTPPPPKKSNTGLIIGSIVVVGLVGFGIYYWKTHKKA